MDEKAGKILRNEGILTTADIARTGEAPLEKTELARDRQELAAAAADRVTAGAAAAATASRVTGGAAAAPAPAMEAPNEPLFTWKESDPLHVRWNEIQVNFVDEPRHSVEEADKLVAETMRRLAEVFARERETLEKQWDRGESASTEDLRIILRRYRSFFGRLLSV